MTGMGTDAGTISTGMATDGATVTSSASATGTGGVTSTGVSTTGAPLQQCDDALTPEICQGPAEDWLVCGWHETQVYRMDPSGQCELVEMRGICVDGYSDDVTCGPDIAPTCADERWIFQRPAGDGLVEIIEYNALASCGGSPGNDFVLCDAPFGDPPTYDPPQCGCGCG